MARKVRIQCPGVIYQVMNRGDRRQAIFGDDEDRQRLLQPQELALGPRRSMPPGNMTISLTGAFPKLGAVMVLLAEWRIEDCRRHNESGAGFNFTPRQPQIRSEEAIPFWAAPRHTETPEGTIVRRHMMNGKP